MSERSTSEERRAMESERTIDPQEPDLEFAPLGNPLFSPPTALRPSSSGRDSSLLTPHRHPSAPKANKQSLGWARLDSIAQPSAFRTPQEQVAASSEFHASQERVEELIQSERVAAAAAATRPRPSYCEDSEVESASPEEAREESASEYGAVSRARRPSRRPAPEILDEEYSEEESEAESEQSAESEDGDVAPLPKASGEDRWLVDQPKTQPLKYEVPLNTTGGVKVKQLAFDVDFSSSTSVAKANKARALAIWRQKDRLGMTGGLLRPSTVGREYTEEHNWFIVTAYEDYAMRHEGRRLPFGVLWEMFAARFPDSDRTEASLSSHVDRVEELKALKNSYPTA